MISLFCACAVVLLEVVGSTKRQSACGSQQTDWKDVNGKPWIEIRAQQERYVLAKWQGSQIAESQVERHLASKKAAWLPRKENAQRRKPVRSSVVASVDEEWGLAEFVQHVQASVSGARTSGMQLERHF